MMAKKKGIFLLAVTAAIFISAAACTPKDALPRAITDNISELRTNIYTGSDAGSVIGVITGEREAPYKVDGVSSKTYEYAVITYSPATVVPAVKYSYSLTASGKTYTGVMELHPMGTSFAADIKSTLSAREIEIVITNDVDDVKQLYNLTGRFAEGMLTWEDAVKTAMATLNEPLTAIFDGKKLAGEVFIKFTDEPENSDKHYWYVAFTDGEKTIAALIDAVTGQVIASRTA
jgi:hypothetical protein